MKMHIHLQDNISDLRHVFFIFYLLNIKIGQTTCFCVGIYSNLFWLSNALQRNPGGSHHGVPDETFVPHLHNEAEVQPVDLTEGIEKIKYAGI